MSLRLVLGRSGTGKSTMLYQEIQQRLSNNPRERLLFIVPDQMTHQTELALISSPEQTGILGAEVVSFSRLALRVLQETEGGALSFISKTGIHMLLRKYVEEYKEELTLYASSVSKPGFIEEMHDFIQELKRYEWDADSFQQIEGRFDQSLSDEWQGQHVLEQKLHDVALIYKGVENALQNHFTDAEDLLQLLIEQIPHASSLQGLHIYVDGFHEYTPLELSVLNALMHSAARVTVTFTLDRFPEKLPEETALFRKTHTAAFQMLERAKLEGISVEPYVICSNPVRFAAEGLRQLEAFFGVQPIPKRINNAPVTIQGAVHRRAEVEAAARRITALVRDEGYMLNDIAVFVRNMDAYGHLIQRTFSQMEISFFMDQKKTMLSHPLVELVRSALDVVLGAWRYEPVFRCVKTGLVAQANERLSFDELENHVLAYGIYGAKRWGETWSYRRYGDDAAKQTDNEKEKEARINAARERIYEPFSVLENRLKRAKTVREKCTAMFLFLEQLGIDEKLQEMEAAEEAQGEIERATEHRQAWQAILNLFDQFVDTSGEEELSFAVFKQVVISGLESLQFSLVPPAVDQVIVATMEQSRVFGVKAAFVLGVNDGQLPAVPSEGGLLSEEEREKLSDSGFSLATTARQRLLDETFVAYMAFTKAAEELYISYALADEEGRTLQPSPWVARLADIFPDRAIAQLLVSEPSEDAYDAQEAYLVHPRRTLSLLASQFSAAKRGYALHDAWWAAYNLFVTDPKWEMFARMILKSLFYENKATSLSTEMSKEMYGDTIQTSVSRMESFQSCAFAHYARYGLKLRERSVFRLGAPDIGELFHAAIKYMTEDITNNHKTWRDISSDDCGPLAERAIDQLAPLIQKEILFSTNRHAYILKKLKDIVARTASVLHQQSLQSGFTPVAMEVGFGANETLPSPVFTLENGVRMELVGRIDQVDISQNTEGPFIRIIDYKSSARDLSLAEIYYGLSLQMLVYLDVVLNEAETWLGKEVSPAGMLYFHIHNPLIKASAEDDNEAIEQRIIEQFRMKGYMLANANVAADMDQSVEGMGKSTIAPYKLKKDGQFDAYSSVLAKDDISLLRDYSRGLMRKIGLDITSGETDIAPYMYKGRMPCEYCDFKTVCQFDESFAANQIRLLKPQKDNDIMAVIEESMTSEEEDE
ncbi:helicase-exonuclease AddAB subunit AddB [Aureibacillus halotolerans]|uniref:ATP-dependent helicase/deoxyribonuclease subunit B n=1 Tax=Aureibacillus halotolerans TaxID=1508390 RepID=A0A4R6U6D6_9BACI|nr:helicase-exonuclease AddAB subunit AddB [Aureibacillus halotolerans]TDQ42068.1 DNA helicase/exodeoxyribonuclease V subunit B [Aureibacillus halotolerans]